MNCHIMGESYLSFIVRRATAKDATQMMQIQINCVEMVFPSCYPTDVLESWKSHMVLEDYIQKTQAGWCFVAEEEGKETGQKILGFGYLNYNTKNHTPEQFQCELIVENLYVDPQHHKKGVGKKLMVEMELQTKKEGFTRLGVFSSLSGASFYEAVGFKTLEESLYDTGTGHLKCQVMVKEL